MPRRLRSQSRRLKNQETTLATTKRQSRLERALERAHHKYKGDVAGLGTRANRYAAGIVNRDFDDIKSKCPKPCAPLIRMLQYIMLLILSYSIYDATMTAIGAPSGVARKSTKAGTSFIARTTLTITQATAETAEIVSNSLLRSTVCAVPTFVFNPNAVENAKSLAGEATRIPFDALDRRITKALVDKSQGIGARKALSMVQGQLRRITGSSDIEPDQLLITERGESFKEQVRDAANVMVSYMEKVTNPCYTLKQQAKRIQEVTTKKLQLDLEHLLLDLRTIETVGTVEVKEAAISAFLRVALLLSAIKILSVMSGTCTLCTKRQLELEGPEIRGEDGNLLERLSFRMRKSRKASRKRRSAKKKSRKRRSAKKKSRKRRSAKKKSRKRKSAKRKASRKASRKRKSAKRKVSRKRRSAKRKVSRKRKSVKRKVSRKRKSAKRKSRKRKSAKRKASRKRKSAKRKASRKRKSAKRKASRKRKSAKRKASRKRKRCPPGCVKRRSAKRKNKFRMITGPKSWKRDQEFEKKIKEEAERLYYSQQVKEIMEELMDYQRLYFKDTTYPDVRRRVAYDLAKRKLLAERKRAEKRKAAPKRKRKAAAGAPNRKRKRKRKRKAAAGAPNRKRSKNR